jgi:hypothetical protein
VRLVEPSQLCRLVRPPHRPVHVDLLKQPTHPQNAGEHTWAETDLLGELSIEMTVAHAESRSNVSNRTGRFRRELPDRSLAPRERVAVERFWRPQRCLDHVEGLYRGIAGRQLAPQTHGPGPCLQQVHNPTPQRRRRQPKSGPAADRGGDDSDAERLALRLVDDRPVMRADQKARVGDQSGALPDRALPDGVADDPVGAIRSRTPAI